MFIRAKLETGGKLLEWGWDSDIVPGVGDNLWLGMEEPDKERTGNEVIWATVTERLFPLDPGDCEEVWLTVSTDDIIDDIILEGYIADSTEWPATGYSKRARELASRLAAIKKGGTPEVYQ